MSPALLLVHDGNRSNRNQARALAMNMDLHFTSVEEHDVSSALKTVQTKDPNLVIGCGARASRFVAAYTQSSPGVKTVQILHPRFPFQSSTSKFDCLVIPHHDLERRWFELDLDPSKVVKMHGALGWNLDYFSLLRYRQRARAKLGDVTKKTLVVLMGGSLLHPALLRELLAEKQGASNELNVEFVTSRRTMQKLPGALAADALEYREALAVADYFAVDADSISMVADVLTVMTERNLPAPLYLYSSPAKPKHDKFLVEMGNQLGGNVFQRLETVRQITAPPQQQPSMGARQQLVHFPNEAQRVAKLVRGVLKL